MADEIVIPVRSDVDTSQIEDLQDLLGQISDTAVTIQADNTAIAELEAEIANLQEIANEEMEWGFTEGAQETEAEIEALQAKLEELKSTTESIDGSGIGGIGEEAENSKESVDGLLDSVEGMASLGIGGGLAAGLASATNAAGSYEDDMKRVGMALKGVAMTSDEAEKTYGGVISRMTKATGRGAADVRNHLITLGGAGIKSEKLLSDSFKGISAAAFQTKNPISTVDDTFRRMVQSGMIRASSLSNVFQISMDEIGKAMGMAGASSTEVSKAFKELDEGTRASVLSTALTMHYGEEGNKNYLTSFQQLTDELDRAKDAFMRLVGEALLPTVVPAIHIATDIVKGLASAFKGLPEPVQQIIGGFGGLVLGASALGLVLNGVFKIVRGAIAPFQQLYGYFTKVPDGENLTRFQQHLNKVKDTAGALKDKFSGALSVMKQNAISAGSTIRSSLGGALSSLKNTIQTSVIPAVYSASLKFIDLGRNALTAGLNALRSVAMWVAQKVALIASTIATQGLAIAQGILNVVMAMNPIMLVVMAILILIGVLLTLYYNVDSVRQAIDQLGLKAQEAWNGIVQAFQGIYQTISQALSNAWNSVTSFVSNLVNDLKTGAENAVNGFIDWIKQLPGKLREELDKMLDMAGKFAVDIGNKLSFGGLSAVTGWEGTTGEHSPGYMYEMFAGELKAMENAPKEYNIAGSMSNVGNDMVSSFNSDFGSSTDSTSGTGGITNIFNFNNLTVDSRDRLREIEVGLASLLQEADLRRNR